MVIISIIPFSGSNKMSTIMGWGGGKGDSCVAKVGLLVV